MKKGVKTLLIVIGIVVAITVGTLVIVIGGIVVHDLKQESLLEKEIVNLTNRNILTDEYSIEVKTTGDYAYVESAIKKYYKELSDNAKVINDYFSDEELVNILSYDNLNNDRPDFNKSYKLLDDANTKIIEALDNISNLCSEDYIKNLIDRDKIDDYYYDLYRELMYTEKDLEEFANVKADMENLSDNLNEFMDKVREIFDLLKENDSHWKIVDNQLYFDEDRLVDEYNTLYYELSDIADRFEDTEKNVTSDIGSSV